MGWILISRAPMRLHCHVTAMTSFSSSRIMQTGNWVCNPTISAKLVTE